jgi:hypothetical protein
MPVATRSMRKQNPLNASTSILLSPVEFGFVQNTKQLLFDCEVAKGKQAKMRIALQIYKDVNSTLENLLIGNQMKWVKFAATVYNKTTEFYNQMIAGDFNEVVDKTLVENFIEEFTKARKFLETYFTNLKKISPSNIDMNDRFIDVAMREIEKHSAMNNIIISQSTNLMKKELATSRPRRSVSRVDYTGMDTIEPESEFDGITDIWYDLTVDEDPDYVFEEEYEDEAEYY